jgi:hypothetical protein
VDERYLLNPCALQYKARCDFLVPALKQSSRTRASLTIVETTVDTMVSMVQAHASYRTLLLRASACGN